MEESEGLHLLVVEFPCERDAWRVLSRHIRGVARQESERLFTDSIRCVVAEDMDGLRFYRWSALVEPFGTAQETQRGVASRLCKLGIILIPEDVSVRV